MELLLVKGFSGIAQKRTNPEQVLAWGRSLKPQVMITQYQVAALLNEEVPEPAVSLPTKASLHVYTAINALCNHTRKAMEDHNATMARKCFKLAEKLYRQGDNVVRMLIENCFVYSFSSFIPKDNFEKLAVRSFIPECLYSVYIKQVTRSGN